MLKGLERTLTSATGRGQRNEEGRIYLRDLLRDYPLRKPFEDGRLADTGRPDELQAATTNVNGARARVAEPGGLTTGLDFVRRDRTAIMR